MLPVVDLGCYLEAEEKAEREDGSSTGRGDSAVGRETARLLQDALCQHGFCYLSNHGVPAAVVSDMFATSKAFFQLPERVKEKYARGETTDHGWGCLERERVNPERPGDLKETFNVTPCEEVDYQFFRKCHSRCGQKGNYTTARSVYYPPLVYPKEGQLHCGEHTDYECITLLFQDDVGGLQVRGKDGQYHDVQPIPGTVLVNIGDLMQRWTADKFPATEHRVIVPRQAVEQGRSRQSLTFFCQPDDDTIITCLDGSDTYPPVNCRDYLWWRLHASY